MPFGDRQRGSAMTAPEFLAWRRRRRALGAARWRIQEDRATGLGRASSLTSSHIEHICGAQGCYKAQSAAHEYPRSQSVSPADWYRTIRDQIQHEDNLIVQRLSWLMAAQSFFFTGYAIIANASPQARSPLLAKQQDLLFNIIPAVACISDVLIFCSVIAGVLALGVELTPRMSMQ
jgi:hypothetical protein